MMIKRYTNYLVAAAAVSGLLCGSCAGADTYLCGDVHCPAEFQCISAGDDWVCAPTHCGNGQRESGELCDDGNNRSGDGCSADCLSDERCGNGYVDEALGEVCDNMTDTIGCNADCTLPLCGDGHVNVAAGEACDDSGETDACDPDCTVAACGDGYINLSAGETCDDRNRFGLDSCSNACQRKPHITAGRRHTCVLLDTGVVRCWGAGASGQLGYGNTSDIGNDETPFNAGDVHVGGSVVQIAAGFSHTCALRDNGTVRCWGVGVSGQLGYSNTRNIGDNETPATAGDVDIGGYAVQLTAGHHHTCARLDTGAVRCWGLGSHGQLGYGNTDNIGDDEAPAVAGDVDVGGLVVQITSGDNHTCALLDTGKVRCWGKGDRGRLGYGNTDNIGDDEAPATAGDIDVGGSVIQIAAGGGHTCALLDTGKVRCWGNAGFGQLGYGNTDNIGDDEAPAVAGDIDISGSFVHIAAGGLHTCAQLDTGAIRCWGHGGHGQLGYGNTDTIGDDETPAALSGVDVGGSVVQLAAGWYHTCALLDTGEIRCWGEGAHGQLGYGNTDSVGDDETPADAGDVLVSVFVTRLAAGLFHTCAVLDNGAVRCWGYGDFGQLGYGNRDNIGDNETPAAAGDVDVGGAVVQVTAGFHTCALLDTGKVRCWGPGNDGRLGYVDTVHIGDDETPASVGDVDVGGTVIQLAAGTYHTCALLSSQTVRCWGNALNGRLGYGNTRNIGDDEAPSAASDVAVGGSVVQIAAGEAHTCARLATGGVRCWGNGLNGRLGYGNTDSIGDDETPAAADDVDVGGPVADIVAGDAHTCALLDNGAVRCWGSGEHGQLGYGNTNDVGDSATPAAAGDVDVGGSVVQLVAGGNHTCALLTTGAVRCWGQGVLGQLGYGNVEAIGDDETPAHAEDVDVGGRVVHLAAGQFHTCALLDTGAVRCWGFGSFGRLGYGNQDAIGDNETPATVGHIHIGASIEP